MTIIATGRLCLGRRVYAPGDPIAGLTPEEARKLVDMGLARFHGAEPEPEPVPAGRAEAPAPKEAGPTKAELERRCRELGLRVKGTKAELEARIAAAEADMAGEDDGDAAPVLTPEVPR